jgi:hypothetical protein
MSSAVHPMADSSPTSRHVRNGARGGSDDVSHPLHIADDGLPLEPQFMQHLRGSGWVKASMASGGFVSAQLLNPNGQFH